MNASELRIGNWVYLISKDKPYQIMDGHDIEVIHDAPMFFDAKPIPLTEEWLIRLGFEEVYKSSMHSTYWNKNLSYYFWHESGNKHAEFFGVQINCIYLHQLQNLYFALTGEELSVK